MEPEFTCSSGHSTQSQGLGGDVSGKEFFQVQALPIQTQTGVLLRSLTETWQHFRAAEKCDSLYRFQCPVCTSTEALLKGWSFTQMSAILCLQLKRYEYNRQTGAAIILNHVVTYRAREFFEGVEYELQAVVFHAGDSAHAGHYWTIAGHGVESAKKWWKYNDSARQEAAVGELLESWTLAGRGKPYLLFYEKVDSQRRLPSLSQASAEKHGAPGSVPLDLSNIMSLESSCQEAVAQEGHNAAGDTKSISTLTESQIIAAATLEVVAGCTGFSRMWQEHNARCGYPKNDDRRYCETDCQVCAGGLR